MSTTLRRAINFIVLASVLFTLLPHAVMANTLAQTTHTVQLFVGRDTPTNTPVGQAIYEVFFNETFVFDYQGGAVCLSSSRFECLALQIDDAIQLDINLTTVVYEESRTNPIGPFYFDQSTFQIGSNQIILKLIDLVGSNQGGSDVWLIPAYAPIGTLPDVKVNSLTITPSITGNLYNDGEKVTHFMNDEYELAVQVQNTSNLHVSGELAIQEQVKTKASASYQDTTIRYLQVVLSPNETRTYSLKYTKSWNWTTMQFDDACNSFTRVREQLKEDVLTGVGDKLTQSSAARSNIYNSMTTILDLADSIETVLKLDQDRYFKYHAYSQNLFPPQKVESNNVHIVAGMSKQLAFYKGLVMNSASLYSGGLAIKGLLSQGIKRFQTAILGAAFISKEESCKGYKTATDPDPNYQHDVTVIPLSLSTINQFANPEKQFLLDQLALISLDRALNEISNLYEGARVAGDSYWMERHAKKGIQIAQELAYISMYLQSNANNVFNQVGYELTAQDIQRVHTELMTNGAPVEARNLALEVGVPASRIDAFEEIYTLFASDNATVPSTNPVVDQVTSSGLQIIAWNLELQEVNGAVDIVPPVSTVAVTGQQGNNNWYVSDVQMILSANDNASGVSAIQWSQDSARTWNNYQSTITLGEGVHNLLIRAIDNSGNMEYPPKQVTLKVDYTPPQTTATATGPLDINNIFRDNISITFLAQDNLSGVQQIELSSDNGLNWQTNVMNTVMVPVTGNGITQYFFLAQDLAGNREVKKDSGPLTINRYALFGNSTATAVEVDRSTSVLIDGAVHSNGSAKFTLNTGVTLNGPLTTKNGVTNSGNTSASIPTPTNGVQVPMLAYPKAYFTQNADVVHNGNLVMQDTSSIISGTMHVKGNLTIYGTTVAGDGVIVVDGNIYDYSTEWNVVSQAPGTGVVLYSGQNIELYGTSNYGVGMMYAPNGTITVRSTDLDINGSLVANRVFFDRATSANVTYSAAFASGTYTLPITSGYVEAPISVIPSSKGTLFDSMEPTIGYGRAYGVTNVEQSPEYPSEGSKSLKVSTNGSFGHFTRWLGNQNWSGLQQLEVHVVNPSDSQSRVMLALTRNGQWYQSSSQTVGPKSAAILTFNLTGISGMTNVNSFGFIVEADPAKTLYFDNVRRLGISVIPSTNGQLYDSMETTMNWGKAQGVTALAQSTEYPSDGSKSLKVTTNGSWGNFNRWLGTQNWSTYKQVEVHVVNPSDTPAKVMMLMTRTSGGWYQSSAQTVQPKSAAILRYNLTGITGLNSVSSFGFIVDAGTAKDLYFDNIRRNTTVVASNLESEGGIIIFLPIINR